MTCREDVSPGAVSGPAFSSSRAPQRLFRAKLVVAGLIVLTLLAVLAVSLMREAMTANRVPMTAGHRPSLAPPRPPLTVAEERYAHALWAIHNEVKNSAYRLTFGGLNYKLGQADGAELRSRLQAAAAALGHAEARVRALVPPPSLGPVHAQYLDAVHLFQRSATEMLKVTEDGRDDHLVAAHPLSQEASQKLLRVGNVIWPGEYLPN